MGELEFDKAHNVVCDALEEVIEVSDSKKLELIGKWYFNFLISKEERLTLKLPDFNIAFSKVTLNYIRLFTLTYNLFKKEPLNDFKETYLLDIFKYTPTRNEINIEEFILDFKEQNNEIITWSNNTYTSFNSFLPVFRKDQLESKFDLLKIYYAFKLFQSIRLHSLINHPVLFDFEKEINLIFSPFKIDEGSTRLNEISNELNVELSNTLNDDEAADFEEKLKEKKITNRVNLKYPYSRRPHLFLTSLGDKRLNIEFNSRFYYNEPLNYDLILVPEEFNQLNKNVDLSAIDFQIVNTDHNKRLFKLLAQIKEDWGNLDLNKFIAPYPKYWLMFINQSVPKEEWIEQFKVAYPSIVRKPIINDIEAIIAELHDLDWINNALKGFSNPQFIFPELKGLRYKRLNWAFNNFKYYVEKVNSKATFIDSSNSIDRQKDSEYIYLNSFDVIGLSNNTLDKGSCKVIAPDFMYFGYQPWIQYHIFKYKVSALLEGARSMLDPNYNENKTSIEASQKKLINTIKDELNSYRSKYEEKEIEEEPIELNRNESEDLDLLSSEENEIPNSKIKDNQELEVRTTEGEVYSFRANENVLLQRDFIRVASAKTLQKADLFLDIDSLKTIINDDNFINRLSEQPERTKTYQHELFTRGENIYGILRSRGLLLSSKNYFIEKYLLSKEDITADSHKIPLRKSDWKIICDFLSIEDNERDLAFIAYYGSKKQNRLRELYRLVLNLYVENNNLQSSENPEFLKRVKNIVEQYEDIFTKNEDYNQLDIAETIASNVMHNIDFKEVKEIKIV